MPRLADSLAYAVPARIWRIIRVRPRLFIGLFGGIAAFLLLPDVVARPARAVLSWDIGVLVFLGLSAFLFTTERMDRIAVDALEQQEGEWTIFWLTLAAASFSFFAIVNEFTHLRGLPKSQQGLHIALVALTLFASWLMTHTTFAFRYAHEYYEIDPNGAGIVGGLEFPDEKRPDYLDFLYFSLVIGMTFQVSDVQITARKFRRLAAAHGVLAFLFNTIILALTINLAAGML